MRERIWGPLGIREDEASFYPDKNEGMKAKMADMSSLNEKGEDPAARVVAGGSLGDGDDGGVLHGRRASPAAAQFDGDEVRPKTLDGEMRRRWGV